MTEHEVEMHKRLAEAGDYDGMFQLAWDYQNGWGNMPEEKIDLQEALKWLLKAKEGSPERGCYYLGNFFLR